MTVKLYVLPSNTSSRKMKSFLESKKIKFEIQNMLHETLTWEQLKEILMYAEDGVDDILSTHSKDYKMLSEQGVDFEELTLTMLHGLITEHPNLIKAPIVIAKKTTIVGFSEETTSILDDRKSKKDAYLKVLDMIRLREDKELEKLKISKWDNVAVV